MEDQGAEITDDSSIKPVSSLRSHFEQMGKSTTPPATVLPLQRSISPKPTMHEVRGGAELASLGKIESLRPPYQGGHAGSLPSSNNLAQPRPISMVIPTVQPSPAVTVDPPRSPPKNLSLNLTLDSPSAFLSADELRRSSTSGSSSPRHFRVPSRPNTPLAEGGRSPSLPRSQPPEPPPPRRSGEMRREPPKMTMGPPPPVNRADKPKVPPKQRPMNRDVESMHLAGFGSGDLRRGRPSPFSTPPSSGSSPEPESLQVFPVRPRPLSVQPPRAEIIPASFEPPPVHHHVVAVRRYQEITGPVGSVVSQQVTGDLAEQRPALPIRPTISANASPRGSSDIPRSSIDVSRPVRNAVPSVRDQQVVQTFSTPPKRIFSTPTTQVQTPPRHGRSMTVDQTSERAPAEFRTPVKSLGEAVDTRGMGSTNSASALRGATSSASEYPDPSQSNRRPPFLKHSVREISTKYDTRLFDVCGEFVCTTGMHTRVWSLISGDQILGIAHGETIRMTAVAFKAAENPANEGSSLWLGNNIGELVEVNINSQSVISSTANAHVRREVVKIYRNGKDMWTLDDGGGLLLWSSDKTGSPNLGQQYQPFRVPKGHTFSMIVENQLWYATGKDLRIFELSSDRNVQFQVLNRPLSQSSAGEITAGTLISTQPYQAFFGHNDGKVSIYSRRDHSCVGVVNVSIYKLNCMTGVDQYLWAGFNTGAIYIYDTSQTPWVVKKDWRAHENPVVNIIADRSSFWNLGYQQVVSLGADNILRPWDGQLEDDWLETELQSQDHAFCKFQTISTLVMTWNAGASTPSSLRYAEQDAAFFRNLLQSSGSPDIAVFGFQELVDLEDKAATAKSFFKSKKKDSSEQEHMSRQYRDWRDHLIRCFDDYMPKDELYHLLHTSSLVGLFTCVFVRAPLRDRITSLSAAEVKRGMGGRHGNKGALILRFRLDDTSMCFVNCHLAAGQTQTKDRNYDVSAILESTVLPVERDPAVRLNSYIGGGDGTMILDHEICVLNGDLNYRIDTMSRDAVINAVKSGNLAKLLERDQLLVSRRKNASFRLRAFHELPIRFNPTYKYDVGTDNYDSSEKKRAPAWCDRILFRGRNHLERLKQLDYRRHEVRVSDHRPVTALFHMTVKTVLQNQRDVIWNECLQRLKEVKKNLAATASMDFLTNVCGLDSTTSKQLLDQHRNDR